MRKFFFDCGTRDATASLGILSLRVMIGLMMLIGHGIPKIQNFATQKDFFYVPAFLPVKMASISMMACIGAEVAAATLLILGLATRSSAFILGLCMVVAAFGAFGGAPWFQKTATLVETKEVYILYLIPMIAIILAGAGNHSLDSLLYRETKRRRW
jgi:putative oxidoreductase